MVMINPKIPKLLADSYWEWFFTEIRAFHILEKRDDLNNINKPPYTHKKEHKQLHIYQ